MAARVADYRGAMGLAVGDWDGDADLDMFVTHWIAQENALFENGFSYGWKEEDGRRRVMFMDNAEQSGLVQAPVCCDEKSTRGKRFQALRADGIASGEHDCCGGRRLVHTLHSLPPLALPSSGSTGR